MDVDTIQTKTGATAKDGTTGGRRTDPFCLLSSRTNAEGGVRATRLPGWDGGRARAARLGREILVDTLVLSRCAFLIAPCAPKQISDAPSKFQSGRAGLPKISTTWQSNLMGRLSTSQRRRPFPKHFQARPASPDTR